MKRQTTVRRLAALTILTAILAFAAPDAQAYLGDNGYTVKGTDTGVPFEECWGFRTMDSEIYIDMMLSGTWQEFQLLSWLAAGPFSFSYFMVDGGDFTASGFAFVGFLFGRWAHDADPENGSLIFGWAGTCDDI